MYRLLSLSLILLLAPLNGHADENRIEPVLQDGIYTQDWFLESFMELGDDLAESQEEGKRLAISFEQKGCIYCKRIHTEVLATPSVNKYVQDRFNIVQINMFGDREVTDLDGEVLTEKELAIKWGVLFTPTFVFLPDPDTDGLTDAAGNIQAVAQMPGAFGKGTFTTLFDWVFERGYTSDEHFQKYVARRIPELKNEGVF